MKQTDGRAITNPENAQSFSHAEIKQAADEMNPDGLDSAFDAWSKIATAVTNAGHEFENAIKKAVEQHWEGAAAESAARGVRDYATRVGEFGESLNAQSTPLSQAASAAAKFKLSVPDVVDTSTNPRGPELRNSSEEQARDDMTTQYIQPYGTTAPAIPTLPPPVNPISAPPPGTDVDTGTGTNPVPGKTTDNGSSTGDSGTAAENNGNGDQTDKSTEAAPTEEQTSTEPAATQAASENSNNNTNTSPASTTSTRPTSTMSTNPFSSVSPISTPVPTTPLPSTPSTVTSSSLNGAPNRSGTPTVDRPSSTASPSPGTSRPAVPTSTTPGATAGAQPAATPGRVGAPGMPGYSGMLPPGARGRGEDDGEHKTPGYLRTEEHAKELLGEVKPTVPPVIGAE